MLHDVCNSIEEYHCTYGWAPTIMDITNELNANNEANIRRIINILKERNRVFSNGSRTLRTPKVKYLDERIPENIEYYQSLMSKSERKIYRYLVTYILQKNYSPAKREIAEYLGYNSETSVSCIQKKLKKLQQIGAIKLGEKNSNRTIHVIGVNAHVDE